MAPFPHIFVHMTQRYLGRLTAGVIGLVLNWVPVSFGKSKPQDDFPDYNRLEYAKPLPPPDQQVTSPPPGSIQMEVGSKKKQITDVPPETLSVPIRPRDYDSGSEPPISDLLDDYKIVSTTPTTPASMVPDVPPQAANIK
jgi:hypothetical protein